MNENELRAKGFVPCTNGSFNCPTSKTNLRNRNPGTPPKLERDSGNGALGKVQVQGRIAGRFLVRVTSVRKRLLDQDNLCEKYHVDCCRYAGLLPGDSPATTQIEVGQEKAEPGSGEFVRIEIFRI